MSDSALEPISDLQFIDSNSVRAEFAPVDGDIKLLVEAHAPGVYRLRCGPAALLQVDKPTARARQQAEMLLARQEAVGELAVSSRLGDASPAWRLEQGEIAMEIQASPLQVSIYRGDELLMQTAHGNTLARDAGDAPVWRFDISLGDDDALHGAGETTEELDRRGEHIVSDRPESRALPLVWSTRGWGAYANTIQRVEHDLGSEDPERYRLAVHDKLLDLFVFVGDPSEILNQYTALTGRAGQPGLALMGVWLDQAQGQSVEDIMGMARTFRERNWGLDVVSLTAPALSAFQTDKPALEWDSDRVRDARELFTSSSEQHLQLAAVALPGVLADTELFADWEDRAWLLVDDDSNAYVHPGNEASGGRPFGLLDLTHKDVYKLWVERLRQQGEEGLAAIVCNAQFDIPDDVTARSGDDGAALRTLYPMLARAAVFEALAGHKTPQEGVVASTDLFPAAQRYAWQEGIRTGNDWADMARSLRTSLALGNCGIPLQTHALGSAAHPVTNMTPELYIRWLAMCVLSGNFRFQAAPGLIPSDFDEATQALVQHWLQWRYRLVPYVLGILEDAVRTGMPVQRSMALSFPDDAEAHAWDDQYMLGPALLVAPVLQPGNEVEIYLPAGTAWWDLNTGWRYEGGTALSMEVGLDTMPVFGREGHMLCLGPIANHAGEFNSARILDEVWMFGMPEHSPVVLRNKIRVMQMQGSSYIKGLEGLRILPSEGLEVKRRGAEVRISRAR